MEFWRITLWIILLYLEDIAIFGDSAILEAWLGDLEGLPWFTICWLTSWRSLTLWRFCLGFGGLCLFLGA